MVKTVPKKNGPTTALVVLGWISFFVGLLASSTPLAILFLAIARVLP
jgi:hypothetical protein